MEAYHTVHISHHDQNDESRHKLGREIYADIQG